MCIRDRDTPTEVARVVMKNAQGLYDIHANMYKLTWTTVDSHSHVVECEDKEDFARVTLVPKVQTLIVEAVDERPFHPVHGPPVRMATWEMPHYGMVYAGWLKLSMPHCIQWDRSSMGPRSEVYILHSIVPFKSNKRMRDADHEAA